MNVSDLVEGGEGGGFTNTRHDLDLGTFPAVPYPPSPSNMFEFQWCSLHN